MIFLLKKTLLISVKKIIINIYSKLILWNLLIIEKNKNQNLLYSKLGFGDSFAFYIFLYNKIINKKTKIITFSYLDYNNAKFIFGEKKIIKPLFFVPKFFPIYGIISALNTSKIFNKYNYEQYEYKIKNFHREIIERKFLANIKYVSKNLIKFKKKKYFLFFIKYYDNNNNDLSGSRTRQTNDFTKIVKILKICQKYKFEIIILGNDKDKSIPILRKIKEKYNFSNIEFFKDYSKSYSIIDQLFIHYYSKGGIGSDSGAFVYSWFLKKKIVHFDTIRTKESFALAKNKNIKFLYKSFQRTKIYDNKNFYNQKKLLIDNSYESIKKKIYSHLIK